MAKTSATVYATLVTDAYVDGLLSRLLRRGYAVSPTSNTIVSSGPASALAVFDVEKEFDDEDYDGIEEEEPDERDVVLADVIRALKDMRARWHSIIVQVGEHTIWENTNIESLPADPISPILTEEPFG